ncbi:MAG: TMEM175 family protein, partial [Methanobacteriaceae archaeon]|nr:TMEM175 family protein [Methanobacteriaceae archaeon]
MSDNNDNNKKSISHDRSVAQVILRDKNRLENFVDAVFAIAITILVLDLAVPVLRDSNDVLIGFLINIWPK